MGFFSFLQVATKAILSYIQGIKMKTEETGRKFFLVDAKGKILGRMSTKIASILRGKHKPTFSPFRDMGDSVIVINAKEVKVTGKKAEQKTYFHHSGYPGGEKNIPFLKMLKDKPEEIIKRAVKGMLPHNKLGRQLIKRLKIYPDAAHPHLAQKVENLSF